MGLSLSSGEPSDNDIPGILIDRGWRQGTVFHAPSIELWCIEAISDEGGTRLAACPRTTPSDSRFVVVSQTCDIAALMTREPVVEALACDIEPDLTVRATLSKSFRKFEIDRVEGLIAHAMYRVPFDKRALLELTPYPWPDTSERLNLFSRWLARRASRSAIPDPIVAAFVSPLRRVLDTFKKQRPDHYQAFNYAIEEIRLGRVCKMVQVGLWPLCKARTRASLTPPSTETGPIFDRSWGGKCICKQALGLPDSEAPPFEIHLVLLLSGNELSGTEDDAIGSVCASLREALAPAEARLGEVMKMTKSRMSVELYHRTALIDLENVTYSGDDIVGAEPSVPF